VQDREIVAHMLVAQSLVNALFHLAAWIVPGDYAPGAVVSVPATGYFFAWVRRQARATAAELILAVAVGTVVAAVAIGSWPA
jgi:heme A synthase